MKSFKLLIIFAVLFSLNGFSQTIRPLSYRVEKIAMSTPMTTLDEIFFMNYFHAKPVNVYFDGKDLKMTYDNGKTLANKEVTEVSREEDTDDGQILMETILFVDNALTTDTITFVMDYEVGYVQLVLPTKNSVGENIGYTSYRQFIDQAQLALKQ